jgi:hypothetical protein
MKCSEHLLAWRFFFFWEGHGLEISDLIPGFYVGLKQERITLCILGMVLPHRNQAVSSVSLTMLSRNAKLVDMSCMCHRQDKHQQQQRQLFRVRMGDEPSNESCQLCSCAA